MTCWRPNCSTLTHRPLIVMMFNLWSVVGAHTGGECIHFQYNQYNCVELAPAVLHLNARQKERKRSRERKRIVSLHERAENHLNFKSWHVDILEDTKTLKFTQAICVVPKTFLFRIYMCRRHNVAQGQIPQRELFSKVWFQLFKRKTRKSTGKKGERNIVWVP